MNIEIADYGTIVMFGTLEDLQKKMDLNNEKIDNIVNWRDESGVSILEKSIASRRFEIAKYLLLNGANVNVVSKAGNNEFHFLASNINCEGAVEIGLLLLDKGTSLEHKEAKYGNTAFFSLCFEALKQRSDSVLNFLDKCFEVGVNIDEPNKNGYSVRKLIDERGTNNMKSWRTKV